MQGIKISNNEYRSREGISSSDLKKMVKSPAHFRYYKDNPQEDTPALLFGRAAHKYVLETYDFFTEFEIAKDFKYGNKADKEETQRFICQKAIEVGRGEEWDSFIVNNPKKEEVITFYRSLIADKEVITEEQFKQIEDMRTAAYSTPFVSKLLMNGEKELSFWGVDKETGLTIKCRPDCLTELNGKHILIDFKTCSDAENIKFCRDSIKFGYDLQLAMYRDILRQNTGQDYTVVIIAQEKTPPYVTNVFQLSENYLKSGEEVYKEMLKVYKECLETDNWHGYMKNGISILGQPDDEDMEESEE